MCDICSLTKTDPKFTNGKNYKIKTYELSKFGDQLNISKINLCYVHDIEFFSMGERRFLETHFKMKFKVRISESRITTASSGAGAFG